MRMCTFHANVHISCMFSQLYSLVLFCHGIMNRVLVSLIIQPSWMFTLSFLPKQLFPPSLYVIYLTATACLRSNIYVQSGI